MGEHVLYQGKDLGRFHVDNHGKISFAANGLDTLVTLIRLNPGEEVELEICGKMIYEEFQKKHLT